MKQRFVVPLVLCLSVAAACGSQGPQGAAGKKLVILGFDGLDPDLVTKWMEEGKLPHMRKIAAEGSMRRLETTHAPDSPSAWASFATGVNAGKHNIYDFLIRDTSTYVPAFGMMRHDPARFFLKTVPIAAPKLTSLRGGTSFWVHAGRAGVRSSILTVPVTFPPEEVPNGELLSGLPLPDIRGAMGTFYYFGTDLSQQEEGNTPFGGVLKRLVFDGEMARTELIGPRNPIEGQRELRLPLAIRWNKANRSATIEIGDSSVLLQQGQWSNWVDLDFRVNFLVTIHGMAQMYLIRADDELQLYVSPVNWKPDSPPAPMSSPATFSGDVFERVGYYRTLGWAEATWALNEGRVDEQMFMDDLFRAFDDRAQVILQRIDGKQWDLLVGVIESTDRVQHMMWRLIDPLHPMYDKTLAAKFGDAIERVYQRADDLVGEVVARLEPGTPVLIVSGHGFHSFRHAVNLNTWLVEQGFMTMQGDAPVKTLGDLLSGGTFWGNVDWSRTRAYAMGLGQIYLNLKGREAQGVVPPGAEARVLEDDLAARLLALTDPKTGQPIVNAVYRAADIYSGAFAGNAPELQVGFADGYRVSWQTVLGGAPPGVIQPNMYKWSGDHGGYDYKTTEGTLISSRPLVSDVSRVIDIAPTVLRYFGIAIPADIDGQPLF